MERRDINRLLLSAVISGVLIGSSAMPADAQQSTDSATKKTVTKSKTKAKSKNRSVKTIQKKDVKASTDSKEKHACPGKPGEKHVCAYK